MVIRNPLIKATERKEQQQQLIVLTICWVWADRSRSYRMKTLIRLFRFEAEKETTCFLKKGNSTNHRLRKRKFEGHRKCRNWDQGNVKGVE